nr:MAG TPA: hypothetical protein [Bacteriophage sp.]
MFLFLSAILFILSLNLRLASAFTLIFAFTY